jgi:methionyl aminopeptidase
LKGRLKQVAKLNGPNSANQQKFMTITIHSKENFAKMRAAGLLAAQILDFITPYVKEDVTTDELNILCHNKIIENGAIPAPLNYKGFPKSICTSVNHVICHGVPNEKPLKDGDIVNIDVTVILDGWYGDTSRMYFVGNPSIKAKRLTQVTYDSMMLGIDQVKPGAHLGDIGNAIQTYAEKSGFSVVRDYCGHGIGKIFHCEPSILHYGKKETGIILEEGMFFTIEPMINAGKHETILSKHDGWTVTTRDKSLSAQFEHTIGVTKDGFEIFTASPKGLDFPPYKI